MKGVCNGYHNSINVLDTTTLHWQRLSPTTDDNAMRRAYGGMISFSCDNEDLTFVIGGHSPIPKSCQSSASYLRSLPYYYTNECNIFNTTTSKSTCTFTSYMDVYMSWGSVLVLHSHTHLLLHGSSRLCESSTYYISVPGIAMLIGYTN